MVLKGDEKTGQDVSIDFSILGKAEKVIRALNHELRASIINLIEKEGLIPVSTIYKSLGREQSLTSQQLGILREAGILQTKREGKYIYYSINKKRIQTITQLAEDLL